MIGHEFVTLRERNFQIFELVVKKQGKTAHYKGQKNIFDVCEKNGITFTF